MASKSPDCNWNVEGIKVINVKLSTTITVLYFSIYVFTTLIVSIYALMSKSPLFNDTKCNNNQNNKKKLSTYDKSKQYFKCYMLVLLHFATQSINIGVILQLYFISTSHCTHDLPASSLNINILFSAALFILMLYRIISTFKIYTMTHNIFQSIIQFLFDYCIIKSLYVELTKYKNIPYRKHYIQINHIFQWFLRIQSYFNAAPMAFLQLVIVLLYLNFIQEKEFNLYYTPILISLALCFIDVITVTLESDSVVFNPHQYNLYKIWFCRLLFRILDISTRIISMALLWLTVGGYFVIVITVVDLFFIFISCIRLQLIHKGLLGRNISNDNSIMSPISASSNPKREVRISSEYKNREYVYRPNSIGRLIIGHHSHPSNSVIEPMETESDHSNDSHKHDRYNCNNCSLFCAMILHILDYYMSGMIVILVSFRLEDRSSLFAMWFWRYRVIVNIMLMCLISVFGYLNVWCKSICFYEQSYDSKLSFIQLNPNDYYIGFILFVYTWTACIILPVLFIYLANGKIKTDKYSAKNLKDIMINGDVIGIFELEIFGIFASDKHKNRKINKCHAYTLTACNLDWTELENNILMQYLYILSYAKVDFHEIYDPFDPNNNLINQLCRNSADCYQWFEIEEMRDLLNDKNTKNNNNILASCCQCGNFRVFKFIIKHFGEKYLIKNKIISLHYAFHCRGTPFQQKQANRIIVYVLKNTDLSLEQFINQYDELENSNELVGIKRIVKQKYDEIQQLMDYEKRKSRNNNNHLGDNINKREIELLQVQLSNNSIATIEINKNDSDELKSDSDEAF